MKVLCVSDKVVEFLYSSSVRNIAGDADLIIGCGDLPYYYLEFLISMLDKPLFYVHGNHDALEEHTPSGDRISGPSGGLNLDGRIVEHKGMLIGGLEGCMRYKPHAPFQYTDREMWWKTWKLLPQLLYNRSRKGRAIDILVAHSPPLHIHNGSDHVHRGFAAFLWLMRRFQPRYLLHGHHHVYRRNERTETLYHQTIVNNIYPYKLLNLQLSQRQTSTRTR